MLPFSAAPLAIRCSAQSWVKQKRGEATVIAYIYFRVFRLSPFCLQSSNSSTTPYNPLQLPTMSNHLNQKIPIFDIGTRTSNLPRWETFEFSFQDFKNLPTSKGRSVSLSEISCFGSKWRLRLYPGGHKKSYDGMVGIFLCNTLYPDHCTNIFFRMTVANFRKEGARFVETSFSF